MSVGGFFRSLSAKVSQSLEEIKIKSNEASSDIARGMRDLRDSTKAGVEKIGAVLQITDSEAHLYSDIDETAGMAMAAHYSQVLSAIRENNRTLIEKGKRTSDTLSGVQQQTSKDHAGMNALIKQCETLPDLVSNVDILKERCELMIERLVKAEALLGNYWEETTVTQIGAWKKEKELEMETYKRDQDEKLAKLEAELAKKRDSKIAEKRNKAIDRATQMENAESQASQTLQEELDKSIKRDMDDYLIYGFSSKTSAATAGVSSKSVEETKEHEAKLAAIDLSQKSDELEGFLGPEEEGSKAIATEEEDDTPTVRVDDTTIDAPEE